MKIRPVEAELFHADGQTDMSKLIIAFRNYAKAPKIDLRLGSTWKLLHLVTDFNTNQLYREPRKIVTWRHTYSSIKIHF